MDYSNITPEIRDFFIADYSAKARELRAAAANPRARKAKEHAAQAQKLEGIINELKAA